MGNGKLVNRRIRQRKMTGYIGTRKYGQRKVMYRRDGNSCLGNRKNGNRKNGHLFTTRCHTDDVAVGLCYMSLLENHILPNIRF